MPDEPQDPQPGRRIGRPAPPAFEAPALQRRGAPDRSRPAASTRRGSSSSSRCSSLILCIGIILGWTLVGSQSPEKLDDASAAARLGRVRPGADAS